MPESRKVQVLVDGIVVWEQEYKQIKRNAEAWWYGWVPKKMYRAVAKALEVGRG